MDQSKWGEHGAHGATRTSPSSAHTGTAGSRTPSRSPSSPSSSPHASSRSVSGSASPEQSQRNRSTARARPSAVGARLLVIDYGVPALLLLAASTGSCLLGDTLRFVAMLLLLRLGEQCLRDVFRARRDVARCLLDVVLSGVLCAVAVRPFVSGGGEAFLNDILHPVSLDRTALAFLLARYVHLALYHARRGVLVSSLVYGPPSSSADADRVPDHTRAAVDQVEAAIAWPVFLSHVPALAWLCMTPGRCDVPALALLALWMEGHTVLLRVRTLCACYESSRAICMFARAVDFLCIITVLPLRVGMTVWLLAGSLRAHAAPGPAHTGTALLGLLLLLLVAEIKMMGALTRRGASRAANAT